MSRTEGTILHDVRVVHFGCPSHSSRVLGGVGLVGRNPTMNTNTNTITPRLRRGGVASFSSLFLLVVVLLYYILFDSASELERWALLPS